MLPSLVSCLAFVLTLLISVYPCHGQRISTIDQLIGQTIVGATKKGSVWTAHIRPDGIARFHYANGSTGTSSWRRPRWDIICFLDIDRRQESCKTIRQAGQGLHWITLGEHTASSQILMTLPAGQLHTPLAYNSIESLQGKVVIGRTLKDRDIWRFDFFPNWRYRFASGSNRVTHGNYFFSGNRVCIVFPDMLDPECREMRPRGDIIAWVDMDGEYISEVIYVHGQSIQPSQEQAQLYQRAQTVRSTMSQLQGCSADRLNTLRAACVVARIGPAACANTLGEFVPRDIVPVAAAGSYCQRAAQSLVSGAIGERDLGMAVVANVIDSIGGAFQQSESLSDQIMGAELRLFSARMVFSQIAQCMSRVQTQC